MSASSKVPKVGTAPVAKPRALWPTVRRLMGYMGNSGALLSLSFVFAIAGTVMQVLVPRMLGSATTTIFQGATGGGIDFARLGSILLAVALLYGGVFLFSFLQERIMMVVAQKTTRTLRSQLKAKMDRVPVSYFDKHQNGDLMSVAANDIDNIATTLQTNLTKLVSSVILMVGILWMMLSISPLLTLIACIVLPGGTLVMKLITPRAQSNNKAYWRLQGELGGQIEETYQGFSVVKSFGGEADALERFRKVNDAMYESGWRAKMFGGSMMPSMMLVENITYILLAAAGAVRVVGGAIPIGDLQAFLTYSTQFSDPVTQMSQIWNGILSAAASAERVFQVLDADEMEEKALTVPPHRDSAKVVFSRVNFGYTDKPVLERFSLQVEEGQTVAVVGHTGAGKSTLLSLLERFYEIQGGGIRIDGQDIRTVTRSDVRARIGMVLQDTWLFSGTIYQNICFGNENATPRQVYAAAEAAFADDFIRKLPDGYDTVLDEDAGNLSQGQRQLITIARAFVADPEILVLDEATSNVDSRTEILIQRAMKELMRGRTSFVVAHRLSTIYDADRIVVMQDGGIAETGTHRELLGAGGAYVDIYNSQFAQEVA